MHCSQINFYWWNIFWVCNWRWILLNQLKRKFWIFSRPVFHHHLLPDPTYDAYGVGFATCFWSLLHFFVFSFCYDFLYYLTFSVLLWKCWLLMCLFVDLCYISFCSWQRGRKFVLYLCAIYVLWYVCCDMLQDIWIYGKWIYDIYGNVTIFYDSCRGE